MSFELPTVDDTASIVCRMLRTKTAFGGYASAGDDWRMGESTTAVYWCLKTMATAGPDDDLAHPKDCCQGRACFQAPLE